MDEFTKAYIAAALWSTPDHEGEGEFLDENYSPDDLHPDTLQAITEDCEQFQAQNRALIQNDLGQAGHDFWLTRNGHGAGFWDGDWPEHGDALTRDCEAYGEVDLYACTDGKIYHC